MVTYSDMQDKYSGKDTIFKSCHQFYFLFNDILSHNFPIFTASIFKKMRRIILSFIIFRAVLHAQDTNSISNFYLENSTVVYHRIFKDSLDSASVIERKLLAILPAMPNINNVNEFNNGIVITGNYETQNGTEGYPWELLKAYFIIEIKNGKYRVTLSNIIENQNAGTIPFTYLYAKNNPIEWRSGIKIRLGKFDAEFANTFWLPQSPCKSTW
jgi:hypothetical protein